MKIRLLLISLITIAYSDPEIEYTIRTIPNADYQNIWIAPEAKTVFPFSVKGCRDARVALANRPWDVSSHVHEIGIGSPHNNHSYIMNGVNGTKIRDVTDPAGYLNCNESRPFWVGWTQRIIEVGKSKDSPFLTSPSPISYDVNMLSFDSNDEHNTEWQFSQDTIRGVSIQTPSSYGYGSLWKSVADSDRFVFGVQACSDAHVILAHTLGDPNSENMEVVIGGANNSRSMIKDARSSKVMANRRTKFLSCDNTRTFWVKWNDTQGWVWVGRGSRVGQHEFLKWKTPKPFSVRGLGITSGYGFSALWKLSHIEGNQYTIETDGTPEPVFHSPWIMIQPKKVFQFDLRVRACSDAHVLLAKVPGNTTYGTYEFQIGTHGNSKIAILKDGVEKVSTNMTDVLSCTQFRVFWFKWKNHVIEMGSGQTTHLSWKDTSTKPPPPQITSLALSTANNESGTWEFKPSKEDHVRTMTQATPGRLSFGRTWISTIGETFVTFKVKTCKDAHVILTEIPRNTEVNNYHIIIGGWHNKRSVIRRGLGQNGFVAVSNVHNLLDCNKPRDFWISWFDGKIKVGTGLKIWEHKLMEFADKEPFSISSLGISSRDAPGEWEFVELGSQELGEGKPEDHGLHGTMSVGGAFAFELIGLAILIGITLLWIFIGGKIRHGDPSNPAIAAIHRFNEKTSEKFSSMKSAVGDATGKLKNRMKSKDDPDKYGKM